MRSTIVPVEADLLGATADARHSKEAPMVGSVKMPGGEGELAQFPSDGPAMQLAVVCGQRGFITVQLASDRMSGELAVLESAGNALAHQRIDPGRIAGEKHASPHIAIAAIEPSN